MADIGFGVIGLGRMGSLHAEHLRGSIRGARLVAVAEHTGQTFLSERDAPVSMTRSVEELLETPAVEAVVIASPSNLHHEHIALVGARGLPMFCEKPLAASVSAAEAAVEAVERAGVPFQIAFQRRFDPGHVRARQLIAGGAIGEPELFRGISSDHIPPVEYLRTSGGLFWDLGVHDFDSGRFLMDDDIVSVHATGTVKVEPRLAEFGDIDYGLVVMRFRRGGLGVVQNSWRAPWGYEIRAEVCGSQGRVVTELDEKVPTRLYTREGFISERYHEFVKRFEGAYRLELQAFVDALHAGQTPSPTAHDGLAALLVSDAATRSARCGEWVEVSR